MTIVGLGAISFLGYFIVSNLVVSLGDSIDRKVFWKVNAKELKRGNYVLIQTDEKDIFAKGKLISKIVGCASGEVLEIKDNEYYCGEDYLGRAKNKSRTGISVTPFNPCGSSYCKYQVPEGQYFVVGTHKDSYDSRYFGFVDADKIVAKLLPLW